MTWQVTDNLGFTGASDMRSENIFAIPNVYIHIGVS
jgi:hypothetical protein